MTGDIRAVLALDPGKTTGWAIYNLDGRSDPYTCGEANFDETCDVLQNFAISCGAAGLIVSESFTITVQTAKNTQAPWSLELIGVARRAARAWTGRDLLLQTPAAAKNLGTNSRLELLNWYVPGKGHAMDAARHLLLAMVTRNYLPAETVRKLALA